MPQHLIRTLLSSWLLVTVTSAFIFNTPCPVNPPCRCYGNVVNCVHLGLQAIPQFSFTTNDRNYYELEIDMRSNRLTSLPTHAFGNIDVVKAASFKITLKDNNINSIDKHSFSNLSNKTVELDLSNNKLTSLPNALESITAIKSLKLLGNQILYLDDHIMTVIGRTLDTLWLDMGSLAIWPRAMQHLTAVTQATLDNIPFGTLPDDAFTGMGKMDRLTITNAKLTSVPSAICGLTSMTFFSFTDDSSIPNAADFLFPQCSAPLTSVFTVNLNNNNLFFFPGRVFTLFPKMTSLGLHSNFISDLPSSIVPTDSPLYYLYMSDNQLTRIPSAVSKFSQLLTLVVSENPISSVDGTTLSGLQHLRQLTLSHSPVTYIDPHAFSTSYTLQSLYLEHTNLTSVPAAMMHSADRFAAFLMGSPVQCTCTNLAFIRAFPVSNFQNNHKHIYGSCVNTGDNIQDYVINMPNTCN